MRKPGKRVAIAGLILAILVIAPTSVWLTLSYQPSFYRDLVAIPPKVREEQAKNFVAHSLQLRNDIHNEPNWEAIFSDEEVNAWLARDLVEHFADQLPPEVKDPRVAFEDNRLTLAFQLDQGAVRSVIWIVAAVRVPEENVVSLTIEKIRAGALPIPAERFIDQISHQAKSRNIDLAWSKENGDNVATLRYSKDPAKAEFVLERLDLRQGQVRLSGRTNKPDGVAKAPKLPDRRVLQLNFPRRNTQAADPSAPVLRSETGPAS